MANFPKMILTNAGLKLQAATQSGQVMKLVKIKLGSGSLNGVPISTLNKLIATEVELDITGGKVISQTTYQCSSYFSNQLLTKGFFWREWGVFALDENDQEVLYCYTNAGDAPDYIPIATDERIEKYLYVSMIVGNSQNITVEIPSSDIFISVSDKATTAEAEAGVDDKGYMTPLKTKQFVEKFVDDNVTIEKIGAAKKDHDHTSEQITDTIPLAKGGTGGTTAAEARENLGGGVANGLSTLDGNSKVNAEQTSARIVTRTVSFTFALTSAGCFVSANSDAEIIITIPTFENVAFPVGTELEVCRMNTGAVTFTPAEGVEIYSVDGALSIANQYGCAVLKKLATDTWLLVGDLE